MYVCVSVECEQARVEEACTEKKKLVCCDKVESGECRGGLLLYRFFCFCFFFAVGFSESVPTQLGGLRFFFSCQHIRIRFRLGKRASEVGL